ncbi:hypothetical protein [Agrobacterium rubi]|uniref:hypothetical protein n=1 Tax=Agrobacterium rubi TaxID=28099 RepID=UPI0015733E24|nr:hypothetical protein [Agrobacterium rubi]NTE87187.1 hypothetical protein [Agrobacterium rubi]NTF03121.1 hypothetical protein [Agrobacterium rubi]
MVEPIKAAQVYQDGPASLPYQPPKTDIRKLLKQYEYSVGDSLALYGLTATDTAAANDATINRVLASPSKKFSVPEGVFATTKGQYDILNKRLTGPGQIKLAGYAQAPQYVMITSPQPRHSDNRYQFFDTGFDLSHSASFTFVGAGVNPAVLPDIYTNYPEWNSRVHVHDYTAGFNKDPADHALGRSGAFVDTLRMYHGGQGDLVGRNTYAEVYATRPGASHFLSVPAAVIENGNLGISSGVGCVYLNHSEYIYTDSGNPAAVIDSVRNYFRTNAANSLGQVWVHDRPQSAGSVPIEAFYAPQGLSKRGIDFGGAIFDASKAAVALKANDRIYWNAVSTPDGLGSQFYSQNVGQTFSYYDSAQARWVLAVEGVPVLQPSANDVYLSKPLLMAPGATGALLFANGQITFALVDNTHIALKARGSDGVTRTGTITLT